jgi:hypothetical protein
MDISKRVKICLWQHQLFICYCISSTFLYVNSYEQKIETNVLGVLKIFDN